MLLVVVLGVSMGTSHTISWGLETANVILHVEVGDEVTWKWDQVWCAIVCIFSFFVPCLFFLLLSPSVVPSFSNLLTLSVCRQAGYHNLVGEVGPDGQAWGVANVTEVGRYEEIDTVPYTFHS